MDSTEEQIVHACGVCESIINADEITRHPCMEGYGHIFMDRNLYVYPSTEDGSIIRRSNMGHNAEEIVLEEPSMTAVQQLPNDIASTEELLIEEVSKREILYNYHLPIHQRSRLAVSEEWLKVSEALNGEISAKEAQKRWKILRDTFCRRIAEDKQPSGAAGSTSKKRKWKHFDRMLFLRDTLTVKPTTTNVDDPSIESCETERGMPPSKRISMRTVQERPAINKIADAISALAVPVPPLTLPPPPSGDDVDGLFLILGGQLRTLERTQRTGLIIDILQFVYDKIN